MNPHILENAATYVNAYRNGMSRRGVTADAATLRGHVVRLFGAVYAAILVP
ncbi:hypothetical protein [Neorhizobium galegae]|uniref:hypothetical protein n=1 Tax=Neorhizobium galegae TaxID=399 RepID=UPI00062150F8|nr:hypothetical protein [Neorhizobium galegae]CDZ55086.1 Hypothetical protein NGAL_HAMBI2427_59900 [Neorhizobium galegae bv. orientalis]